MPVETDSGASQTTKDAIVASHTRLLTQLESLDLSRRVSAFSMQMIHDAPLTVASLASSPLPTEHVERLGAGMGNGGGWAWLKNINSTADQPGSGNNLVPNAMWLQQRSTAPIAGPTQAVGRGGGTTFATPPTPDIVVGTAKAVFSPGSKDATVVTTDQTSPDTQKLLSQLQSQ